MLVAVVVIVGGCRTVSPPQGLSADWQVLAGAATPYRALYTLACCGRQGLLVALRGNAAVVHLSVAAPPQGSVLEVWGEEGHAEFLDKEHRCRALLVAGKLPVIPELSLPLAPALLATLVAGRLPATAAPWEERPGWVVATVDNTRVAVQVTGTPARATGFELSGADAQTPSLKAVLSAHHGLVPGTLEIAAGGRTARLELKTWEQGVEPVPPPWLELPKCGGGT